MAAPRPAALVAARARALVSGLSAGLGIDLGTANTVVCRPPNRIILNEASVMVVPSSDGGRPSPLLVGSGARQLIGRTPVGMTAVRPVRDGVITDLQTARAFIVAILRLVPRHPWERLRPRAVVGVPAGATSLERRALTEAVEEAGVGHVDLLPEPIAGAIGCGVDPLAARASMVVDVGGGTAEVTAFSFGGILATRSCRVAGDEMTVALSEHLRQEHQLLVGELAAEELKLRLRDPGRGADPLVIEGRDVVSGRPRVHTLVPTEVAEALRPTVDGIIETLSLCLGELPPQAVGDIMADGVVAFGGGSLLHGFAERLEEAFGFPVTLAGRPLTCVAEGAATALANRRLLEAYGD